MDANGDTFEFFETDPEQLALDLLQTCSPHAGAPRQRAIAKKALEISENCLEAWLRLAQHYKLFPQSRDTYLKAIAIGKKLIEADSTEDSPALQLTLRLYQELGRRYYHHDELENAANTFKEALTISPTDPLNISADLVLCYLYAEQLEDADALAHSEPFASTLAGKVTQTFTVFKNALPSWTADQMEELEYELYDQTHWQWVHSQCESLKRHYRAINHSNAFFTYFMLNPYCASIELPETITAGKASEALAIAQAHSQLWQDEEILVKLLEDFPWTNPLKREINEEDKSLLKLTMQQLEEHREQLRSEAEKDYLGDYDLY